MKILHIKKILLENYKILFKNITLTYLVWIITWIIIAMIMFRDIEIIGASLLVSSFTIPSIILYYIFNLFSSLKKYKNLSFIIPFLLILLPFLIPVINVYLGIWEHNEGTPYLLIIVIYLSLVNLLEFIFIKKYLKK